jgi:hypothetical protein
LADATAAADALSQGANLGDFPPKNANLGIFLAFGELGDF